METVAVIEDELYDSWTFDARGTRVLTGGDRLLVHERGADGWTSRPIGRISDLEVGPACDVARASAPLARTRAVSFAAILAAVGALVARRRSGRV